MPKYSEIKIPLTGNNGNAFYILGMCLYAMREAFLPKPEQDAFLDEAICGNYTNLLVTCMKWFDVN